MLRLLRAIWPHKRCGMCYRTEWGQWDRKSVMSRKPGLYDKCKCHGGLGEGGQI